MEMVDQAVVAHDGHFFIQGEKSETLGGNPPDHRIVILEFQTRTAAEEFHRSEQYEPAINLRQSLSKGRLVWLSGLE